MDYNNRIRGKRLLVGAQLNEITAGRYRGKIDRAEQFAICINLHYLLLDNLTIDTKENDRIVPRGEFSTLDIRHIDRRIRVDFQPTFIGRDRGMLLNGRCLRIDMEI